MLQYDHFMIVTDLVNIDNHPEINLHIHIYQVKHLRAFVLRLITVVGIPASLSLIIISLTIQLKSSFDYEPVNIYNKHNSRFDILNLNIMHKLPV